MLSSTPIKMGDRVCAYSTLLNPCLQITFFCPSCFLFYLLHLTLCPEVLPLWTVSRGQLAPSFQWNLTNREDQQEPKGNEGSEVLVLLPQIFPCGVSRAVVSLKSHSQKAALISLFFVALGSGKWYLLPALTVLVLDRPVLIPLYHT